MKQDEKLNEMLAVNTAQKQYYEVASGGETSEVNSAGTNLWRTLRKRAFGVFATTNRNESIKALHRAWIGDVGDAKVLDLGVGGGNPLSLELAASAREYVALDLSQSRIDMFRRQVEGAGIKGAKFYAADFLSDDFTESGFDVIYAMAVFHHFKHLDAFLEKVESKLAPGGRVVTYDPAQVWLPVRVLRALFRPLQTDAAWEFPFGRTSLRLVESRFEVLNCQGVLGASKWASAVGLVSPSLGASMAQRWHDSDMRNMTTPASLRRCLHVSYHLKKRS